MQRLHELSYWLLGKGFGFWVFGFLGGQEGRRRCWRELGTVDLRKMVRMRIDSIQ
jgi:hypothetical protein